MKVLIRIARGKYCWSVEVNNKKDQQAKAQIRDEQANTVSDPITMAQLFNEYFVSAPGKVDITIFYEKSGNRNDRVNQRTRGDILGLFMRPKAGCLRDAGVSWRIGCDERTLNLE
ncbi:hypothetical protein J6590_058057 [Homalodisca vitripennis]|nr:hypothetical protein J6590_058057 [Homalodisca vitripennis]